MTAEKFVGCLQLSGKLLWRKRASLEIPGAVVGDLVAVGEEAIDKNCIGRKMPCNQEESRRNRIVWVTAIMAGDRLQNP
jgi:hypothetical protein